MHDATRAEGTPRRPVTTFVFASGANGGGSGDAELTMRGHRVLGLDLPGHEAGSGQFRRSYQAPQDLGAFAAEPSPMAGITMDDYVEQAVRAVRRVGAYGPVVLVGGSMGGAMLGPVANAVPDLLHRLVYISAFCCTELPSAAAYVGTPEASTSLIASMAAGMVGDPAKLGAARTNWRSADDRWLDDLKAAVMAEGSEAEFMSMLNGLQPDESLEVMTADARGHKETWGRVPRTYVRHSLDRVIPPALQDRMIREADALTPGNRFDVRTVRTSHMPTRAGWREIVDILDELAP
ncbi:alpha/beta hydrolase [Sphaerisporangium fuscum]|uniref:alpha/beta hydrolase n=1 Tax=Sphaerisporangium fuscum TaxID=2835868 RepID=UPI001BDD3767|nr:alpha/beta hydrolase [Sphaerisporangium fuscum]